MFRRRQENEAFPRRILLHFQSTLVAGLLVILPLFITIWIIKIIYDLIYPLVVPIIQTILAEYFPELELPGQDIIIMLNFLFILLVFLYIAGWFTTHGLGQRMINAVHWLLELIPAVGTIYSPLRTAMQTLTNSDERPYRGVVLVEFPRKGAKSIGLITSYLGESDGEDMLAVYVPTTPIPSSGFLIVVPYNDVVLTSISVDDAMKIIISGGLLAGSIMGDPTVEVPRLDEQDHD